MENLRKPDPGFSVSSLGDVLFGTLRIPEHASLRVAYSGGLDSSVLLFALTELQKTARFSLAAIHVDHQLHRDSGAWAAHCANTCRNLSIPFTQVAVTISGIRNNGPESAARSARYSALASVLRPGEYLLTAHHRDDQAETVLLQLLRGSGIAGLAAMSMRSRLGQGEMVRPLLGFSRQALRAFAECEGLRWLDDPSNDDIRLRRNYLRAEILPRLEHFWPRLTSTLARSADHAAEALALLNDVAEADLATCLVDVPRYPWTLSTPALAVLSPPRQRNLLRLWLYRQDIQAPGARHFAELLEQIRHVPESRQSCVSWPGYRVWRYRDHLFVMPVQSSPDPDLRVEWDMQKPLEIPGIGRLMALPSAEPDFPRLRALASVSVRLRKGGETLRLPGRGHRHVLKKLIQSAGVPPWERPRLPLFYAGRELAAVADRWVTAAYAALPQESGYRIVWEPAEG